MLRDHINIISIEDDLFAQDPDRVHDFCTQFKRFASEVPWDVKWRCQMRVDCVTPDMLDEMKEAGCYRCGYGLESYSLRVLQSMKKMITPQQIHDAIHATLERSIGIEAHFIFGDPAETLETAAETLEFWRQHVDAGIRLSFVIPYPDSPLYRLAIERGLITDRLDYIRFHVGEIMNLTQMSDRDFKRLQAAVAEAKTESKLGRILKRTMTMLRIKCPHCHQVSEFRNFEEKDIPIAEVHCRHCRRRVGVPVGVHKWQRRRLVSTLLRGMHRVGIHPMGTVLGVIRAVDVGARNRLLQRPCMAISNRLRRFIFLPPVQE